MIRIPDYFWSNVYLNNPDNCLSHKEWKSMWRYFDYCCCVCGSQEKLQCDHWISRKRGGSSLADNIVPMCERCNKQKAASHAMGWMIFNFGNMRAKEINNRVLAYFSSLETEQKRELT